MEDFGCFSPTDTLIHRRSGIKLLYEMQPGEACRIMPDGSLIVVHPEREPFSLNRDGNRVTVRLNLA